MRGLLFFIVLSALAACGNRQPLAPVELIAHAGGEIDGRAYTNSREALEKSIADGYRHIEFDLLFTADSVLVAAHSWREFNAATGCAHKGDTAPLYADFAARRIEGRYTPLSAAEINEVFAGDTTLRLVTDKISSPAVLAANFPTLKNRTIVEAFSYEDYETLSSQGYRRVLYSCQASDLGTALVKHLLLHPFFGGRKIEWITMYTGELDNPLFRLVDALSSFKIALFTVNDYSEIPAGLLGKTQMIYTEKIKPTACEINRACSNLFYSECSLSYLNKI